MTLETILDYIANPDKVLDAKLMEQLIDWTTFWIYEIEGELADLDFAHDTRLAELVEIHPVNKAEVLIKLEPIYRERKKKDRYLKALKAYRSNIRRKRDRIVLKQY